MAKRQAFDPVQAYRTMMRIRLVEEALVKAWAAGYVPGEYHSGIGEEGINAGVVMHLSDEDAMALDHRGTGPLIARGADPLALMLEVMGSEEGMNAGRAGHMHLMDPELHAAADGIVGSSGPLAVGHAIALQRLHPGRVAIAFHGEAAANQGMMMEAYNLAAAWKLPVVFVCKDNRWSITTASADVTGGNLVARAASFGLATAEARGERVDEVYAAAGKLIKRARKGRGPGFLFVTCHRPGGHFEGDPIVRITKDPITQSADLVRELRTGVQGRERGATRDTIRGVSEIVARSSRAMRDWTGVARKDPLRRARKAIPEPTARYIEGTESEAIGRAAATARRKTGSRSAFAPDGDRT
ncbi:MAG: thiamine pyrophosphate-dependent dehydrogenase E1 component subunit alpha [Acidimicrobiia bacterium]|nr:thiamine pyrophosphate-dependent dehydrogenase E1 component subunit alpha [Acidimicrobiia bacterium]